jgi:ribonuclease J
LKPSSKLKILPLGGYGEVGRNMTALEYEGAIIVIDCGLMFPESDMPGVDLVLPNFQYLVDNVDRLVGYFITHGHEDHHGALPYVLPSAPAPIYATRLTRGLIEVKLKEHKRLAGAQITTIEPGERIQAGPFVVEPFRVAHSIPDAVGFAVETPQGLVIHTGEYKFDLTPVSGEPTDIHRLAEYGRRGVLALLSDSTNAERAGHTPSESLVRDALERVFERAEGRVIIATFASNISRVQEVINVAELYGRKVGLVGRSMENNGDMALDLGFLTPEPGTLVGIKELEKLPADEVAICCTGSQGEPTSALTRMAEGTHPRVTLRKGDTVVLSATPIPGNEELVHRTLDNLFRLGVDVLYQALMPVHVSGHASREELKLMLRLTKPRYFIPAGGEYRMLVLHGRLAQELGMDPERIFIVESGQVVTIDEAGARQEGEIPGGYIFVDGSGVGDVGETVLRERRRLSESGFIFASAILDRSRPQAAPQVSLSTRGCVFLPEAEPLLEDLRKAAIEVLRTSNAGRNGLEDQVVRRLGEIVADRLKRRPVIVAQVFLTDAT